MPRDVRLCLGRHGASKIFGPSSGVGDGPGGSLMTFEAAFVLVKVEISREGMRFEGRSEREARFSGYSSR